MVKHGYDAMGRHKCDTLTSTAAAGIVTDTYDIRSQLLTRTAKKGSTTTLFSETLRYDSPTRGTAARYAGGLSEVMTLQGSTRNTYGFTYDAAGRLTTTKRFTGTSGTSSSAAYTERGISYNRSGALLTLQRYGSSSSTPQDNYTYTYSGPLLTGVSGKDGGSTLNASFTYDENGNTTADGRAGLSFTYNLLNLPETVTSGNTTTATYHWLADGTKYRVEDASGSGVIYAGDLTYAVTVSGGNTTYALESAEASVDGAARFLKNGTAMTPYYTIKDHLGSVRTIVNASGTVQERNDYYPFGQRTTFGASYSTLAANRRKFSGKEDQTTVASSTLPYLDFGARMYDAKLVRWNIYDPMAEKYYAVNPYVYCAGDPVNLVDPVGLDIYKMDKKTGDITFYQSEGDEVKYDTLVEIKHKRGEEKRKTLISNIEKGILKDGINFEHNDNLIQIGVEGAPTIEGVQDFLLALSNTVDKEIGGYYLAKIGSESISYVKTSRYIGNTDRNAMPRGPYLDIATPTEYEPIVNFHTHLSKFADSIRLVPSSQGEYSDIGFMNRQKENAPNMRFLIITDPYPFYYQ